MAGPPSFVDTFPPEIRLKIYGLLLINDDLADISIVWDNKDGATAKYDLCPAILRTCRQIYTEAVEVLYSQNTFAIDCIGNAWDDLGPAFPSPLTRFSQYEGGAKAKVKYDDKLSQKDGYKRIRPIPALSRILHWKVTVEDPTSQRGEHQKDSGISAFCKAICHTRPASLTICMKCKDCTDDYWVKEAASFGFGPQAGALYRGSNTASYFEILEPLQMLRNINKLEFKCSECEGKLKSLTEDKELFIQSTIKGDSQPDLFFEKYEPLLAYCKTFERWEPCRRKMGHSPSFVNAARFNPQKFNPYQYNRMHPVEEHLLLAKEAIDKNDRELFNSERKIILDYLEPQYQRIAKLMDHFVEVVKEVKVTGGILGDSLYGNFIQLQRVEVHLLLEDLAATFTRDVTPRIRVLMRGYKAIMDQTYNTLDRERCLKAMNASLDVDDYLLQRPNRLNVPVRENRHREWQYYFRVAGADMDRQWLEIRKARRGLFEFDRDGEARGCDIDVEEWRFDELIVWDVMEPTWIGPLKEGSERLPFVENEAWAIGGWGSEDVKVEEDIQEEDYETETVPSANW